MLRRMRKAPLNVTLLALTLNEIDGVKAIMPQIDRSWCSQIIVVDGGSTDGTIEWCRENGYEVFVQKRRGIRFAYLEVMPYVTGQVMVCCIRVANGPLDGTPHVW